MGECFGVPDFSLLKENILADRVVKVTIQASIANYVQGMEKVRKATAAAASESEKLERLGAASEKVGGAVTTLGAASVAAVALVVKSSAEFEAGMSRVKAATNATASEMDKFRNQALTAGAAFGYTAEQVTDAQVELGKAGLATKDILGGGLNGVLALAASDNIELGKAAQIASVAMKQFNLTGADVPHIADELAAGAGKALGGVEQLGDALNQSGLVASNFGFSLEETTGVLSAFADAGLLGSDSGTSLKTMLQALANPSKQSADLMKTLGINVKDANGNFLGAADLAQLLHDKLGTLSDAQRQQALAQIFGSDATRAATVLYKEAGDGIQKYIDQNNDAGYAVEQARIKNNNLVGDLKKLRSAFQSGVIETGASANGALRPLVQTMTDAVKVFNALPEPLKAVALGTTGVVGATGLLAGGMLVAVPKLTEFGGALKVLAESNIPGVSTAATRALKSVTALGKGVSATASFMTGPFGFSLAGAALAVHTFNMAASSGSASQKELASAIANTVSAANLLKTAGQRSDLSKFLVGDVEGQLKDIPKLLDRTTDGWAQFYSMVSIGGASADQKTQQALKSLRDVGTQLGVVAETTAPAAAQAFTQLADSQGLTNAQMKQLLNGPFSDYKSELVTQAQSLGISTSQTNLLLLATGQYEKAAAKAKNPTKENADALADLSSSGEDAAQAVTDTANALAALTSPALNARDAQRQFEAAVDAVTDTIAQNKEAYKDAGTSMDIHTEEGRKNQAALDAIASSAQNVASKLYEQTGSQEQATSAMQAGRDAVIAAAKQYGVTGQAAQDLADIIIGTPTDWATTFTAKTATASASAVAYKAKLDALPKDKRTQVTAATGQAVSALQDVINKLANVNSKSITITTNQVTRATKDNTVGIFKNARGSVMDFYANGGLREKHVAQIAPAGSMRLWAEPETGGEAYIPLASSKRKRSLAIWQETGRRLDAFADGGLVSTRTTQNTLAKNRFKAAQQAQRKAQSAFNKEKSAANRQRLLAAQAETKNARIVAQRAAAALTAAKNAPTGADLGDRLSFRSSVRAGDYSSSDAVRDLYSMGQDSGKYSARQRASFLAMANKNETVMLKLQKQADAAAKAVETASDKLGDLKSASASMASGITGKLTDVPYGNYRSGTALQRALTSRAGKLKQFQTLLGTLQKNGIAPALLNEVASLGVDEGLPLAKSLATMSKSQLSAINKQYGLVQSTSTAIGNQVADANYGKLVEAAEKQLSNADKNADKISKQIADQSKALQKVIGKALGLPGYSAGGYTGDGGTSQIAGVVHGREYVINRYATARNRPYLEALNNGGTVRYMDPTRTVVASQAAAPQYTQQVNVQPMQHVDPNTMVTVLGRETARAFAGMVE